MNRPWQLEIRQSVVKPDPDVVVSDRAALAADNHRHHCFSEIGMRYADHRRFQHPVERVDLGLDLCRITIRAICLECSGTGRCAVPEPITDIQPSAAAAARYLFSERK